MHAPTRRPRRALAIATTLLIAAATPAAAATSSPSSAARGASASAVARCLSSPGSSTSTRRSPRSSGPGRSAAKRRFLDSRTGLPPGDFIALTAVALLFGAILSGAVVLLAFLWWLQKLPPRPCEGRGAGNPEKTPKYTPSSERP